MADRGKVILKNSCGKCKMEGENFIDLINKIFEQQKEILDKIEKFNKDEMLLNSNNIMEVTNFNDMLANRFYFLYMEFETKLSQFQQPMKEIQAFNCQSEIDSSSELTSETDGSSLPQSDSDTNQTAYDDSIPLTETTTKDLTISFQVKENNDILLKQKLIIDKEANVPELLGNNYNSMLVSDLSESDMKTNSTDSNLELNASERSENKSVQRMTDYSTTSQDESSNAYDSNNLSESEISLTSGSAKTDRGCMSSRMSSATFYSAGDESSGESSDYQVTESEIIKSESVVEILEKFKPKGRFERMAENIMCTLPDLSFVKSDSNETSKSSSNNENVHYNAYEPQVKHVQDLSKKNKLLNIHKAKSINPVIKEPSLPNLYDKCVITYVVSPYEFYISLTNVDLTASLEYQLAEYANKLRRFTNKLDAKLSISEYCMAYSDVFQTWNRAKIITWNMTEPENVVVQYVDFGEYTTLSFMNLLPIPQCLCQNPKQVIRCRLANILPLSDDDRWSDTCKNNFSSICFDDAEYLTYSIASIVQDGEEVVVDLTPFDMPDHTLSEIMVLTGNAQPIDKSFKDNLMIEQMKNSQKQDEEGEIFRSDSLKELDEFCNDLPVTYDSIADSMMGYDAQDDIRLCRHTRPDGTCFKGKNCKLEHKQRRRDGITTDTEEVLVAPASTYMPNINDIIQVTVTFIKNPNLFYGQVNHIENKNGAVIKEIHKLMNNPDMIKLYEPFKVNPAIGEFVIAKNIDGRWYRGIVLEISSSDWSKFPIVQVFFVDFGDIAELAFDHVRKMRRGFENYPYQAIPFCIANVKAVSTYNNSVFHEFVQNFNNRKFKVTVTYTGGMCIHGIFTDNLGQDVAKELVRLGLAEECEPMDMTGDNSNILID